METLVQDIKFAAKLLWKDRGFTVTALLTLALCIGANTAIFSVINSILLRPLPFEEADRIMLVYNSYPAAGAVRAGAGAPDYFDRLERTDAFEEIANYSRSGLSIGDLDTPEQVSGLNVTPSLFRLLRVEARIGRIFTEDDGIVGNDQKTILSYAAWQQYYGGAADVIGTDVRLNGVLHAIVGVMPEDFRWGSRDVRFFRPIAFTDEQRQAVHSNNWSQVGRLRPGVSMEVAQQQIDALNAANLERSPGFKEALINAGFHTVVVSFQDDLVRDARPMLFLLWGGVLFVLLIGCVNIANLVLVRSSVRLKELATRFALGAGRMRVVRQLLTESVLLTATGGAAGLFLGYGGLGVLDTLGIDRLPRAHEIGMDSTVVAATLGLAFVVGLIIGMIPIAGALRANLSSVFREQGRTGTSSRAARWARGSMVTAQVAIALVLLIGAGLMFASFQEVLALDLGYEPEGVLTGQVSLPGARYPEGSDIRRFVDEALAHMRAIPGVTAAGAADVFPLGGSYNDSVILAEGYVMAEGESLVSPSSIRITPGYFEAMSIDLRAGRYFDDTDSRDGLRVTILDEDLAEKFWPGQDPLGKRLYTPTDFNDIMAVTDETVFFSVVGVVENVALRDVVRGEQARVGTYYFPVAQQTPRSFTYAIKVAGDPSAVANPIRTELVRLDSELPFFGVETLSDRISETVGPRRTPVVLALSFAVVALLLSAIGIYGVLAFLVTTRTKEFGIRLALGAGTREVFRLVLREGLLILAAGLTLGLIGAFLLRSTIQSQLYGIEPLDPVVWVSVAAGLSVVAFVACLVPARRATRVDPVVALGHE